MIYSNDRKTILTRKSPHKQEGSVFKTYNDFLEWNKGEFESYLRKNENNKDLATLSFILGDVVHYKRLELIDSVAAYIPLHDRQSPLFYDTISTLVFGGEEKSHENESKKKRVKKVKKKALEHQNDDDDDEVKVINVTRHAESEEPAPVIGIDLLSKLLNLGFAPSAPTLPAAKDKPDGYALLMHCISAPKVNISAFDLLMSHSNEFIPPLESSKAVVDEFVRNGKKKPTDETAQFYFGISSKAFNVAVGNHKLSAEIDTATSKQVVEIFNQISTGKITPQQLVQAFGNAR